MAATLRQIRIIITLLAIFSMGSLFLGRKVWPTVGIRQNRYTNYINASTVKTQTLPAVVTSPKVQTIAKAHKKAVRKTPEQHIRHFVKHHSIHLHPNMLSQQVFELVQNISTQTWRPNTSRIEEFRRDLLAATGFLNSTRFLYLTKSNTPVGSSLAFSYGGKPWTVPQDFWNRLPEKTVFETHKRFKTCSIVGSSGVLSGSGCGSKIDQADFIFRFNIAPVKGHEEDVGTKTNFTTLNPSLLINTMNRLKTKTDIAFFKSVLGQFNGSMVWLPAFTTSVYFKFVLKVAHILSESDIAPPIFLHPGHFGAMLRLWRRVNRNSNSWPSSGLYVISAAFDLCDEIHLFGFWYFNRSVQGAIAPYHYYDNIMGDSKHSLLKEFQNHVNLHRKGVLKMNFGKCI